MTPQAQTYLLYAAVLVVLLLGVLLIRRLAKKRRAPLAPAEAARPDLKLVPGEPERAKQAPVAAETGTDLKEGLGKTRGGFIACIGGLLGKKQIDAQLIDQLEEILFTADIGAKTSAKLFTLVPTSKCSGPRVCSELAMLRL